jgi:methylmalonyl-CoA/ethylmalonyl-CoA epimerase
MDEPSLGLSPKLVQQTFGIIRELNQDGTSILLIEQNAVKALAICSRGYILQKGKVVLSGSREQLVADEKVRKVKKIHHIGIAVKNLDESLHFWKDIVGFPLTTMELIPSHKVQVAFLSIGESDIELLTPLEGNLPMENLIREKGGGLDHLCLEVDNLDEVINELKQNRINLVDETPRLLPGRKIAFVDPSSADGVLLEFYELT